jgi:hypothetical protein
MATITITVQSMLNASTFDSYTVSDTVTVDTFKTTIATAVGLDVTWFNLSLNHVILTGSSTLAASGVVNNSVLYTGNRIAHLVTLEDRQVAKIALAELRRKAGGNTSAPYYRSLNTANINLLPTKWSGNTLVDNPNPGGLQLGRPWT